MAAITIREQLPISSSLLEEHQAAENAVASAAARAYRDSTLQTLTEQQEGLRQRFQVFSRMLGEVHASTSRMEKALGQSILQDIPQPTQAYDGHRHQYWPDSGREVALISERGMHTLPSVSVNDSKPSDELNACDVVEDTHETRSNGLASPSFSRMQSEQQGRKSPADSFISSAIIASVDTDAAATMIRDADGALRAVTMWQDNASSMGDAKMGTTNSRTRWKRSSVARRARRFSDGSVLSVQKSAQPFTRTAWFGYICAVIIMADSILIAVETDDVARTGNTKPIFNILGYIFSGWYLSELLMRIFLTNPVKKFFKGKDWAWNWFDIFLIAATSADIAIQHIESVRLRFVAVGRILRALRLFRVLKVLRIVHFMTFMREFHKLVLCLASSLQTLVCAMSLMSFVIFCFSILFVQMVGHDHRSTDLSPKQEEELWDAFGSVGRSMISLYMAITAGRAWGELAELLLWVHPALRVCFFVYLAMGIFGLTNVVTAVFVESAMQATQHYRDLLVNEKLLKERTNVRHMKEIFRSIDADNSGTISLQEMQAYMNDETLKLQEYFEALDLSASDTETLFNLLDLDGSGEVDADEFCDGCMRLGGNAKSFDMNCMWYEQRRTNREILKFIQHACICFHSLTQKTRLTEKQTQDLLRAIQQSEKVLAMQEHKRMSPAASVHRMDPSFRRSNSGSSLTAAKGPPATSPLQAHFFAESSDFHSNQRWHHHARDDDQGGSGDLIGIDERRGSAFNGAVPTSEEAADPANQLPAERRNRLAEVWGWL